MIDRHGDDRLSTRAIRLGISSIQWYNMLSFHPIISMQMRKATSYQRRSGRLSNNQKAQLEQSPFLLRNQDMLAQLLSTHAHQSLSLEIGFGMGEHLLGNAQKNPQKIFIGIDIYRPGIASLLQQIDDHGLKNCYLLEGDAVDYLPRLPEAQFQRIDIHHPDPWPKKGTKNANFCMLILFCKSAKRCLHKACFKSSRMTLLILNISLNKYNCRPSLHSQSFRCNAIGNLIASMGARPLQKVVKSMPLNCIEPQ